MGRAPEPAGFVGFRCTEIRGSKCPWSEFCGRVTRASPDEPSMARRGFLLPSVAAKRCFVTRALRTSNFLPKSSQNLPVPVHCRRALVQTPSKFLMDFR